MTPDTHPQPGTETLPAYILAGGRSVRFGSDKARAEIAGQPLILHVAQALRQVAYSVTTVAQQADHYADLGLDTIADNAADNGPVQGLFSALIHRMQTRGEGWLILAACDMVTRDAAPFAELIDAQRHRPEPCRAVAFRTDRWHPMPGLYHTSLLPTAAAFLADGGRAFQELLAKRDAAAFAPHTETDPLARLIHANTPVQLKAGLNNTTPKPPTTPPD